MYDKEIGMYYLIARYYNPEHGVFLSVDPDPYARPGQKKQGRENKEKKKKKGWKSQSNKRDGPSKPKKHTPGKGHRKY